MPQRLISISNLSCERDDRVLFSSLDFSVDVGDIVQLEGPNGAGKTTLLRILAGLFTGYDGQIFWQGNDIREERFAYSNELLFLGHKTGVKGALTAIENLRFLVGLNQTVSDGDLYAALAAVGLSGYEESLCRNLSAGQQRRVALAKLYVSDAPIWILDEIFTAIDKSGVAQLESFLSEQAKSGRTIFLTTHHQLSVPQVKRVVLGQRVQERVQGSSTAGENGHGGEHV